MVKEKCMAVSGQLDFFRRAAPKVLEHKHLIKQSLSSLAPRTRESTLVRVSTHLVSQASYALSSSHQKFGADSR